MTLNNLLGKIKLAQNIAIFTHKHPDPDAYGSVFAMREICQNLGVNSDIFAVKDKEGYLDHIFPLEDLKTDYKAEDYDLVLLLDLHLVSRLDDRFIEEIKKAKKIAVIDHHKVVEGDELPCKHTLVKDEYAATCEILTEFAEKMDIKITPVMATYLYAGLMGDTSRFLHNNLSKHVFETAILLYEKKANVQKVYDFMFRYETKEQLKLSKFFLDNVKFSKKGRGAYVVFTVDDLKEMKADQEDVKMFSDKMVKIKDVEVSILCIEYGKNNFKFSLRSNGRDTLKLSTRMGGGGHVCASGFEKTVSRRSLKRILPKWLKEMLND